MNALLLAVYYGSCEEQEEVVLVARRRLSAQRALEAGNNLHILPVSL